jgi:hypothetical protein
MTWKARDILISWARPREYRDGEAGYLQLARSASDPDVRDRFIAITQHYRSLAKIEQSNADRRPILWAWSRSYFRLRERLDLRSRLQTLKQPG